MSVGLFEISGDTELLKGEIAADVFEVGGASPTNVIRIDQDWYVQLAWKITGTLKSMMAGTWVARVHLESIGTGAELSLAPKTVALDPCGTGEYSLKFSVPAGTVTVDGGSTPYKIVSTITYLNLCKKPGPMAGFVEGPVVLFYDPGTISP